MQTEANRVSGRRINATRVLVLLQTLLNLPLTLHRVETRSLSMAHPDCPASGLYSGHFVHFSIGFRPAAVSIQPRAVTLIILIILILIIIIYYNYNYITLSIAIQRGNELCFNYIFVPL